MSLLVFCLPLFSSAVEQGVAIWRAHTELDLSTSKPNQTKKNRDFTARVEGAIF